MSVDTFGQYGNLSILMVNRLFSEKKQKPMVTEFFLDRIALVNKRNSIPNQ